MTQYNHINIIFIIILKKMKCVCNFNNNLRINIIFTINNGNFKYFIKDLKIWIKPLNSPFY